MSTKINASGQTITNHNLLVGNANNNLTNVAPSATSGIPVISQGAAADPVFGTTVVPGGGTGQVTLTNHGVLIGAGAAAITQSAVGATGTVLAGNTAADPTFQTIASIGGITTITGNSGGAESPSSGNFNILGTGSITIAGTANTETVQLTGLTNHNVLVGAGTATIGLIAPSTSGFVLTSNGASLDPTFQAPAASSITIAGDTGSTAGSSFTFTGGTSGAVFAMSAGTMTESFNFLALPTTTSTNGQIKINGSRYLHAFDGVTPNSSVFLGLGSGNFTLSGGFNTIVGVASGALLTSAFGNTGLGANTFAVCTSGGSNTAVGINALSSLLTGSGNVAMGAGNGAGTQYTSSESNNIVIGNAGVAGESNVLRIGTTGSSTGQQNKCFIAGIAGVTASNPTIVMQNSSTEQMGVMTYTDQGTWTPTLVGASTAGSTTYTAQQGYYTRIGNTVFAHCTVTMTAMTGTGNLTLGGLPFTVKNQSNYSPTFSTRLDGFSQPVGSVNLTMQLTPNTTTGLFITDTVAGGVGVVQAASLSGGVYTSFFYNV